MKTRINSTEKCLNWIFNNYEDKKSFLITLEQSVGLGKTFALENLVSNQLAKSSDNIFFIVTNNKENRNNVYKNLIERNGVDKEKILLLRSDQDAITHYFEKQISLAKFKDYPNNPEQKYQVLQNWIKSLNQNLTDTVSMLSNLIAKYSFDDSTVPTDFYKLRYALQKDLKKLALQNQNTELMTWQDQLEFQRKVASWSIEMFPDTELRKYQVVVLTMQKFIQKYNPILGKSNYLWKMKFDRKHLNTLIDESDAEKNTMLDCLVDQNILGRREDIVTLFKRVYTNLVPSLNQPSSLVQDIKDENGQMNKTRFKEMREKFKKVYDEYHLESGIRLYKEANKDEISRFIFNSGDKSYLINDDKQYLTLTYDEDRKLNIIENNRVEYFKHKNRRLTVMIKKLKGLLCFFTQNMYSITKAIYNSKQKHKYDIDTVMLQQLNNVLMPTQSEFLADYFVENFLDNLPNRVYPNIKNSFALDKTVYSQGIDVFNITFNEKDENAHIYIYLQKDFPEKILTDIANHTRTILLSATADNPSPISNFDLNWVRNNVQCNLKLPHKLEKELDRENSLRNQQFLKNVNLNINEIGNSLNASRGTLAEVMVDVLKKECQLDLSLQDAAELLQTFPSMRIPNYDRNGIDPDRIFINPNSNEHANDLDHAISFNFARQLKWLITVVSFYQNHKKYPYCNSYIVFTNVQLTDEQNDTDLNDKSWLLSCLNKLGIDAKDTDLQLISAKNKSQITKVKQDWGKGKFRILMTNKSAFSRGINLSYSLSEGMQTKYGKYYHAINGKSDKNQVDVTGIYEEKPTNLAVVPQKNYIGTTADKIKFVYEQYQLQYTNLTNLTLEDIDLRIRAYFDGRSMAFWNLVPMKIAASVNVEQALGRLCRNGRKADNVMINLDSAMMNSLDYDYLAFKRTNAIVEKIVAKHQTQIDQYKNLLKMRDQKNDLSLINGKGAFLENWASNLRTMSSKKQEEWVRLRQYIAKHPIINDLMEIPDKVVNTIYGFYYYRNTFFNNYFYCIKNKDLDLAFITLDEQKAQQKLKDYREKNNDNPLIKYRKFDLKDELSYLNNIFEKNPWIKDQLEQDGYDLDFDQKGQLVLTPLAFNNLYKAAISEKIFEIVAHKNAWNFYPMSKLPKSEFELYDGFIEIGKSTLYVDVKNYNSYKDSLSKGNMNQHIIEREKRHLKESSGQAVMIINLYQFDPNSKYRAQRLIKNIEKGEIYVYPAMFNSDGTLNKKFKYDMEMLKNENNND